MSTPSRMLPDVENTVLGAGPYGLSIVAHLRAAGTNAQWLGSPLESWRRYMPEGMILKSEPFASNLWDPSRRFSLQQYCQQHRLAYHPLGVPVSLARFLEYAEWFRQRATGDSLEATVDRIRRIATGFELTLTSGESFTTQRLVLATGHMAYRVVPPELQVLPEPLVLHSSRVGDVRSYAGKRVAIIGAGQSALETAALLHEAGAKVHILVRRSQLEWNAPQRRRSTVSRLLRPDAGVGAGWRSFAISEFPRLFRFLFKPERRHRFVGGNYGPSGSWWLRDRVENKVEMLLGTSVASITSANSGVHLTLKSASQMTELQVDHIVAATGFRLDLDRLTLLDPGLRAAIVREAPGIPALDARLQTSVPGLYMVGIASSPTFGSIMRFMYGAKHAAPLIASSLRTPLFRRSNAIKKAA